ncbi:MAG: hypothetical protein GY821_12585 [Gammaproteobacteria bacterium]|nr:hypothetical protein [Gammaproteobacteria bacterium]
MKFTIIDPITGQKEKTNTYFEGELSKHIPLEEVEEDCFLDGVQTKTNTLTVTDSSDVVLFAKSPAGDPITNMIIGTLITSILSAALGSVFRKKPKKPRMTTSRRTKREESPTYAFEGIQDTIASGAPIPFMLGKGRKGGQIISTRVESIDDGKKQRLHMLLCLGHGELDAADGVSDVELNGTKITSFTGASYSWRAGTTSQSAMSEFEHSVDQTYYDGREFTSSPIVYTTKGAVDTVDLFVGAMGGLFHNTDQGNMKSNNSRYTIKYRLQTSAGEPWITFKNAVVSGRTTNQKFSIEAIAFPTKDIYEIQLTWTSASYANSSSDVWGLSLHNVVERVDETRTYNGYALLGISAISTVDLNGKLPNVTCIFKAKVNTPTGLGYTTNNAWCIREILSNTTWGLGHRLTSGLIDDIENSWQDLADYCDTQVPDFSGGTETRHEISYVGDRKIKGWDLVNDLLSMIDASIIFSSGKLKIVIDEAKTPAQLYSDANSVQDSLVITSGRAERRINTVNGRYFNGEEDYVPDFVKVEDTALLAVEASKVNELDLVGVTRQSEAIRISSRFLKENIYKTKEYKWSSSTGSIVAEPGDVVKKQYYVSDFSKGYTGYVLSGNTIEIYLDKTVTLDAGKTYEIFIRHKTKNTLVKEDIASPAGTWGKVVLTQDLTLSADEGDLWIIGEKDVAVVDVLLEEVSQDREGVFALIGTNYDENIYIVDTLPSKITRNASPIGDRPPLPIENWTVRESTEVLPDGAIGSFLEFDILPGMLRNAGTALSGSSSTIDLSVDEPARTNFFINTKIQIIDGTGSGQSRKIISYDGATKRAALNNNWSTNPDTTSEYQIDFEKAGEYHGVIVEISDDDADWALLGRIVGEVGSLPIRGQGTTVFIRLTPYTLTGKTNTTALLSREITTLGSDTAPSDVSNFSVVQVNAVILLTWSNITDLDVDFYEIRKGAAWAQSIFVGTSKQDFLELTDFVEGAKTYLIKAVDRTGNYSENAGSFSITLEAPNERQVYLTTDELASLSGTFDGLTVVSVLSSDNGIGLEAKNKFDSGHFYDTSLSSVSATQIVETWDSATVTIGTYVTQTFNIGAIAYARILADIDFSDSTGAILVVEEQHSDDDITYTDWRIVGAGDQKWQYARLRVTLSVNDDLDNPIISKFDVVIDALVRVYRGIGVTVTAGAGGVGVNFPTSYMLIPNINITERSAPTVYNNSPSKAGFTLKHDGVGAPVVDWRSEGI